MDDHMYDQMMSYAECDLIPRFQQEYIACGKVTQCDSYEEMKDLCIALNAVGKYCGFEKVCPSSFIAYLI